MLEQVTLLTYELRDMKRLLFGRKSERFLPQSSTAQLDLMQLMSETAQPATITQEVKVAKKQASAVKPTGRHALPAHLPKVDIVLEPVEDTAGLEKIGEEIAEQLDYTPGKLLVRRYIQHHGLTRFSLNDTGGQLIRFNVSPFKRFGIHIPETSVTGK